MAGQTPRFGFNFFGGGTGGTLLDDAEKFTGEDRLALDRLLAALEAHNHHPVTAIADPDDEPLLAVVVGGDLDAGTEYFYVVAFVNADGLETPAGPESSIATPDLLEPPDGPDGESSIVEGNTLPADLYYYALTALRQDEETPLGDPVTVTVLIGENTVTLTLPDLGDASSYRVWRMSSEDGEYIPIGTSTNTTFVDAGAVAPGSSSDATPPLVNTGTSAYSVTVSLQGDDLAKVGTASAWRIYRSEISGSYSAASLVHEVVERTSDVDPTAPLLTTWTDDGDAPLTGSPKLLSQALKVSPYTFEVFTDVLPETDGYPPNYPIVGPGPALYVLLDATWTSVAGSGSGGAAGATGPTGPTGATGPAGGGGAGGTLPAGLLHIVSANSPMWDAGTSYSAGEVISRGRFTFVALADNVGVDPVTSAQSSANWYNLLSNLSLLPWSDPMPCTLYDVVTYNHGLWLCVSTETVLTAPAVGDGSWSLLGWLVPPGGSAGQVLTKLSSSDGDYGWVTPSGG